MADETEKKTVPTWGYKADGSAKIFDLKEGESLPKGWDASPDVIKDPAKRTADALSGIAPRVEAEPVANTVDPAALEAAFGRISELEAALEAATIERDTALVALADAMAAAEAGKAKA